MEEWMKVEVTDIDRVRKKVEVTIPAEKFSELKEGVYDELKKRAKIKGFRQGKVPKSIITTYYKEFIDEEVHRKMIEASMADALLEAKVEPLTEPIVDFLEEEGRHGYTLECEVVPELEMPSYKGLEVETEPVKVTEEDVKNRITGLREMHAEMKSKEPGEGAEKGDFVIVKYQGYLNGKPLKDVATEAYPLELGSGNLLPDFENAVFGMKAGEEKEINVNFPDDYPDKDIAKKTILFKITAKDVRQKRLPEVNDEFAKDLNYENMEKLEEGLKEEILKEKEKTRGQSISQKLIETLINSVEIPVPERVREKRVDAMMHDAQVRFNTERFTEEERIQFENSFRKDFEKRAEERIKSDIVLSKIADKEGIKVEESDVYERIKKLAEDTKRSYDDVKSYYEKNDMMDYLKDMILQEKTLDFLKGSAVIKEKA
jgi:trigger factor